MDPKQNNHVLRMYYEDLPTENLKHRALAEQEIKTSLVSECHLVGIDDPGQSV